MNTHLKLLGVAILWGASWPWGRMVAQALPPMTAAAMRFALAALGLLIWLGCSKKGWHTVRALSTRQWLGLAVAATCGVFGYALFFMLGLQYVSASRGRGCHHHEPCAHPAVGGVAVQRAPERSHPPRHAAGHRRCPYCHYARAGIAVFCRRRQKRRSIAAGLRDLLGRLYPDWPCPAARH